MRMFILSALALSAVVAVAGCNDGPAQLYSTSPNTAGGRWNDGNSPGFTVDAGQNFQNISGGNNRQQICDGAELHTHWASAFAQPIQPPRHAANLDLAGSDRWEGLTIDQAELINCQSTNLGDAFGDGNLTNQWGDNGEVWVEYSVTTRKIDMMTLWNGYLGTLNFTTVDGMHHWVIPIATQLTRDSVPVNLDWINPSGQATFDEIYRGLMHTYAPSLPQDPTNTTCYATGHCITGNFGDVAYFYVPSLGLGLWTASIHASQPTPSIINRIDMSAAKVMAYAFAGTELELTDTGPTASAGNLGVRTTPCTLQFGMTYSNFLHSCVQVTDMSVVDMTEYNKLIGGISHDTELYSFDIQGVDLNFSDTALGTMDVVNDVSLPSSNDIANQFIVDQSTLGPILNDRDATGHIDLHGTAALLREYARLVRTRLLADAGVADGDISRCLIHTPSPSPADVTAFIATLPAYCTGFEGFITPQAPTGPGDVNNIGMRAALAVAPSMIIGIKPGHQTVGFCWDANGDPSTGYTSCTTGDTFPVSFARVLQVFGHGQVSNLPIQARDVRFFFQAWGEAFLKMLIAPHQADLSSVTVNYDDLYFDSVGAGQFETMEYVDRRFATATEPPTDVRITADVKDGIFSDYDFTRYLYRGERSIYDAMRVRPSDGIGQEENALLTNIFGSPVLSAGWHAGDATHSAYYCATHIDATHCAGQSPPVDATGAVRLDENGQPLLSPYPGAFGTTTFALGPVGIKVTQTFPAIEEAMVSIPLYANPYDTTSTSRPPLNILVPWLPKQPGVGFPIALSGTLDRFVETYQLDFTGTTLDANVDYDFVIDPTTHLPSSSGAIQFLAVETSSFLGQLFLCQDPTTGDILGVRMYDPVAGILNWFQDHPGTTDACQIIVRNSPYNNYVDYITSLTAGVRLGITQGGGFGRVVDGTLFVPGQ